MSTVTPAITVEQFIALPEDGVDRELIRGELRERPMTTRNQFHSEVMAIISHRLLNWLETLPKPRGKVYSGEVGCILSRDPDTVVGIDVAYFSQETLRSQTGTTTLLEGTPNLAVEILSPSDMHSDIIEKVKLYLKAGAPLVWIVDPDLETLTVYRNDGDHQFYTRRQTIAVDTHLPGFSLPVSQLFE